MILLPHDLRAQLLANGADHGPDHAPLLKLFNPCGAATWLASELYEDGDTLFGLADLGFGCPEMGCFSLTEIASVRLALGLRIERDLYFTGHFPLTVYAEAARIAGTITEAEPLLASVHRARELARDTSGNPEFRPIRANSRAGLFPRLPGCTRPLCKIDGCSRSPQGVQCYGTRKYRAWQAVRQQDQYAPF